MSGCQSNITSGFIDLATYDEIEKYLYGGLTATAYFVRETRKSTWFTQIPVVLTKKSGQAGFGQQWSAGISRAGDYLLQTWLRVQLDAVELQGPAMSVRWTRNFMHNLVQECCLTFNDLVAAKFDSCHLDFWAAFTVPAGKRNGYDNMIGNVDDLIQPHNAAGVAGENFIPARTLNLPLPFFYSRDSGVALPTAALPYNEMCINFSFRDWDQLLVMHTAADPIVYSVPAVGTNLARAPTFKQIDVWANYAIVSNDERKRMACAPRDILIEQVQLLPPCPINAISESVRVDIRFSHAIKALFFALVNTTSKADRSNYTAAQPVSISTTQVNFAPLVVTTSATTVSSSCTLPIGSLQGANDTIINATLSYENTVRLACMGSDYYSLVQPYFHAPHIPEETGYHMYSYSLDFICLDPMGSTNYGKLTNVSLCAYVSCDALLGLNYSGDAEPQSGLNKPQTYTLCVTAINNNIIRISGGALGFPVL